ncbi:Gluconate transport-inducing protein [Elasticomyces elasticus]|nr:Gluconate transport-inducing protein [Elasticomyces elasticus]
METYNGHVRTPNDAIILFEACRLGLLPRVQRRLSEKERQSIKSGSVFVWDEREAGMRRWTDGKSWSASRVSGSFLTYREMEGKRGGNGLSGPGEKKTNRDGIKGSEPDSADDGPDGYRYKPDGLMKQSFSITTQAGQHLHLISYYARTAPTAPALHQPSNDPQLRHIRPEKGMYPDSTVAEQSNIPAVTRGPMHSPAFVSSPHQQPMQSSPYGHGPPQPPHHGYASYPYGHWTPPSPMHTPPPNHSPQYPRSGPPQTGMLGHSPLSQMHQAYPQHSYAYAPPPLTAFDRPPPPLSNSGLPPPPPPPSYHLQSQMPPVQTSNHYSGQYPRQYPGQLAPIPQYDADASRRAAQANEVAQQYQQRPRGPACSMIDPQLDTMSGAQVNGQNRSEAQARQDSAQATAAQADGNPSHIPPPPPNPINSATMIPSISSLINPNTPANAEANGGMRARSKSAASGQRGTQDIPFNKLPLDLQRDKHNLAKLDVHALKFSFPPAS